MGFGVFYGVKEFKVQKRVLVFGVEDFGPFVPHGIQKGPLMGGGGLDVLKERLQEDRFCEARHESEEKHLSPRSGKKI
jgi:hypothetical protein